jgi:hypothetical protein
MGSTAPRMVWANVSFTHHRCGKPLSPDQRLSLTPIGLAEPTYHRVEHSNWRCSLSEILSIPWIAGMKCWLDWSEIVVGGPRASANSPPPSQIRTHGRHTTFVEFCSSLLTDGISLELARSRLPHSASLSATSKGKSASVQICKLHLDIFPTGYHPT